METSSVSSLPLSLSSFICPNIHRITNQDMQSSEERFLLPHDTARADSEVQSKVEVEKLPMILRAEKVFGRDDEKQQLLSKLIDPHEERPQFFVIPVLGGGGIGKTTLARLVYKDDVVKDHFQLRAWVKLGGQAFRLQHVAKQLLLSVTGMSCSLDDSDKLDEMVRDSLQSYKCLIVFDEIDSMDNDSWMHMQQCWFNVVGVGTKVLITTSSKYIADLVATQPFELTQLSSYTGWLLCKYFESDSIDDATDMPTAMAKNLASLCQGIPVLLKLVGSMMRYNDKLRSLISSLDFSDDILLPSSDETFVILLCVLALPPYLRQCLIYSALFPNGCTIKKEKIIDMWIAHGLVRPSTRNRNLHRIGDSYFHQLLCRSFFTDIIFNEYGDITEFQMPGLIHKITHGLALVVWKGKLGVISSICEDAGQLSIALPLAGKFNSDHLRMLILSPIMHLEGSQDRSLLEFKDLQSLDLSCSCIRNLPDDICTLKELGYLNLSYTLIKRLPDSITNLSRLQTLDLSWCYHLQVLPKGLCDLTLMIHLDLSQCESLSYFPSGIRFLMSLSSMPLFVLGKDQNCARLAELEWLNQLSGRLEIINLENVMEISEAWNANLYQKDLHHLGLSWSKNTENCFRVLELLEPNPHLKVLDLTGYMGFQFPNLIPSIDSLIKISITDCGWKELPSLGQLPFLKELLLKGMINIQAIGNDFYGDGITDSFPSLQQLGLYDMPRLSVWSSASPARGFRGNASRMFSRLKSLTIDDCPQLQNSPALTILPDLIVSGSNYKLLSSVTSFISLSSLLIKDMGLKASFVGLSRLSSLNKLILFNVNGLDASYSYLRELTALKHLGILHCHQLNDMILHDLVSLQKLHLVDCQNLVRILFLPKATTLIELVVDDCPKLHYSSVNIQHLLSPRKLMIRSSNKFITDTQVFDELELEYLSISGCPRLERQLDMEPSLISHIPCVILGNHKANYNFSKDSREVRSPGRKSIFRGIDT